MSTTIRFSVKLFLAACVVAVTLGDPSRASAADYRDPSWSPGDLRSHFRIWSRDLMEVRKKLAELQDDMKTWRTASRHPRTRQEYQSLFRERLLKLRQQEQRVLRELREIRSAYQMKIAHAPSRTPFGPHALGAPVPPTARPKYDPDTEHYLGLSRKMTEKETKELIGSFGKR